MISDEPTIPTRTTEVGAREAGTVEGNVWGEGAVRYITPFTMCPSRDWCSSPRTMVVCTDAPSTLSRRATTSPVVAKRRKGFMGLSPLLMRHERQRPERLRCSVSYRANWGPLRSPHVCIKRIGLLLSPFMLSGWASGDFRNYSLRSNCHEGKSPTQTSVRSRGLPTSSRPRWTR
jgi:hypothetical protein